MNLLAEITLADVSFRVANLFKMETQAGGNLNTIKPVTFFEDSFERFVVKNIYCWNNDGEYGFYKHIIHDNLVEKDCYNITDDEFYNLPDEFDSEEEFLAVFSYLISQYK